MTLSVVKAPLDPKQPRSITAATFTDITTTPVVIRANGLPAIDYPFTDPVTGTVVVKVTFGDPIVNGASTYAPLTWAVKQQCARRIMTANAAQETLLNAVAALSPTPPATNDADKLAWALQMIAAMVPIVLGQGAARVDDSN